MMVDCEALLTHLHCTTLAIDKRSIYPKKLLVILCMGSRKLFGK